MISKFKSLKEGLFPWTSGYVSDFMLEQKRKIALATGDKTCYINGCLVTELHFNDGRVWTVAKGWMK